MAFTTIQGSGSAATTIVGTSGVDFASLTTLDNYFVGAQQGGDTIGVTANLSKGTIKGGQGNDTLSFTAGASITSSFVNTNSNNDTIGANAARANFFSSTVLGGQGNDTLTIGTISQASANGNKGTDTLNATSTLSSTLFGGQGNDNITSTATDSSTISGDLGNDTITLGANNTNDNAINGGDGNDTFNLTASAAGQTFNRNTITGGAGNDVVNGNVVVNSTGTVIDMGAGIDTVNVAAFTAAVNIDGGADGDNLTGGAAADTIVGGAGNDTIATTNGNDTVTGGTGADTITLGAGFEDIVISAGDSVAATAGASGNAAANNVTIVFGNGVDIVNTALANGANAATSDQVRSGIAGATALANGNGLTQVTAGNYVVSGAWNGATQTFTMGFAGNNNAASGNDLLFFQTNGGDLTGNGANIGTTSMVLIGSGVGGTNVSNQLATTFIA